MVELRKGKIILPYGEHHVQPITEELARTAYDFLCETEPFRQWNMPAGEEVKFLVWTPRLKKDKGTFASYQWDGAQHVIRINQNKHGHTPVVLMSMAHEMIHLYIEVAAIKQKHPHDKVFKLLGQEVCYWHGWDPTQF